MWNSFAIRSFQAAHPAEKERGSATGAPPPGLILSTPNRARDQQLSPIKRVCPRRLENDQDYEPIVRQQPLVWFISYDE